MLHVEEINDLGQLGQGRAWWDSLLPHTRGATFFHSLDWLQAYWRHYGQSQRLRLLVVSDEISPVGILPLVIREETTRVGKLRVLTYPLHDWGTFYGPVGSKAAPTLTAGLRHIRRTRRDWDLLDLRWVDLVGTDRGRTEAAMRRAGFPLRRQAWAQASVIERQGTWKEYWDGRAKKWRHNVERLGRRLGTAGKVEFLRYRPQGSAAGDDDPRWDLFETCRRIAARSWQGASTNGTTLSHASVCEFLRDVHGVAVRTGALDLGLLLLDGQAIAFAYNYHYQGRVDALRMGFDPEFAAWHPGTALTRWMLEDSFGRGDDRYDLGVGSLELKRHWQTRLATSYRYTHFPLLVPRVQLLRMQRWLRSKLYGPDDVACAQTA